MQSQTNISPTRSFYLFPPNSLFEKVNICMITCPSFKSQQKAWPSLSIPGPSHRVRSWSRRGRNTWAQRQLGLVRSHQAPPRAISCLIFIFFSQQTYLISVLETSQALHLSSLKSEPQMKKMGWYTHSKLFNDWLKLWHCKSNRVATIGLLICVK